MHELIDSPMFGIIISIITFEIGNILYKKLKLPVFNSLFISILLIIGLLLVFHISINEYDKGGQIISFFLGPATVILAVPLYKRINAVKKHAVPIFVGISAGSLSGIITIIVLCHIFKLDEQFSKSMIPKSVTVPIGMEVSKQLGGIPSVTVLAIIITGIMGAVIGPFLCRMIRIKDKVAIGIAMGTASHAVGTTKAMEIGETEGAMSSLAIGIAGLITVFIAPIMAKLFQSFGL